MKVVTCFVNGKWRKYQVKDTGHPVTRFGTGGEYTTGGFEVHRLDPPFSPAKGNAYVGNFDDMQRVLQFIHCLRASNIKVEEVEEKEVKELQLA